MKSNSTTKIAALLLAAFAYSALADYTFNTPNWSGTFDQTSGVLKTLNPVTASTFDFAAGDTFSARNGSLSHNTGDITLMYRYSNASAWISGDSSANRTSLPSTAGRYGSLLQTDLSPSWPSISADLKVVRSWQQTHGDLLLSFTVTNVADQIIELGALGFPMVFNNIFTNRQAVDVTNQCVLIDPYIGLHSGYVQVTRLTGNGPNLVITPGNMNSKFEAWNFLDEPVQEPLYYQSTTWEANYAWQVYTEALAETQWQGATQWNPPSSVTIQPGHNQTYSFRFSVAPTVETIEQTVSSMGLPVAVGIPGYVLPTDLTGRLFLNSTSAVKSIITSPVGALAFTPNGPIPNQAPWVSYSVSPASNAFGRVAVTINYASGLVQAVHYYVTAAGTTITQQAGDFLFENQYFTNTSDPFHRAPSVISYNRLTNSQVLQDDRAWIPGLSDEAGAGSFIVAALKQFAFPDSRQISMLEDMVNQFVWGTLQDSSGPTMWGVKRSTFFYQPSAVPGYPYSTQINWGGTWTESDSYAVWRTYDYVHVTALYWSLYKAGRMVPGILKQQSPTWYLNQAFNTIAYAVGSDSSGNQYTDYADVGLMGETIWMRILQDLQTENMTVEAENMTTLMQAREQIWASSPDPYGSEMPWDSTGEEGVYLWAAYFNNTALAQQTLQYIRGYMPTVAHWGWNGNARRYWDFLYAGYLQRVERMIHHYGSGLNALPLLENYQVRPDPTSAEALYDLRVGYGGNLGAITNIQSTGATANAFHSFPSTLEWDYYTGDYGPNFLGHTLGAVVYLVEHPTFGWISFGGNWSQNGDRITVQPCDTVRRTIFVAEIGFKVNIEAGMIQSFTYNPSSKSLSVFLSSGLYNISSTVLQYSQTSSVLGSDSVVLSSPKNLKKAPGGYSLPLSSKGETIYFTVQ